MKIGLDIRPLQGHHKVRGIGMHIHALLRWIMEDYTGNDIFVFYIYKDLQNPVDEFPGSKTAHEIIYLSDFRNSYPIIPSIVSASIAYIRRVLTPIPSNLARRCDVLLGFDFMLGMPKKKDVQYALIGYDLIPLMYPREYLPDFKEARKELGIRQAMFSHITAMLYRRAVRIIKNRKTKIISISDNAKDQFRNFGGIKSNLIRTVYLGNPISNDHFKANEDDLGRVKQLDGNFILFIGGTDWRRKINDVVAAFNLLKARGNSDLKLVLAGHDFRDIDAINDPDSRDAIIQSSYRSDIKLLGFINDSEKQYLYKNALAFVFPSVCEGFGLPILESMQEQCPVVAYNGPFSSMSEVALDGAIIIQPSHVNLFNALDRIANTRDSELETLKARGLDIVKLYSWDKCARQTIEALKDTSFMQRN